MKLLWPVGLILLLSGCTGYRAELMRGRAPTPAVAPPGAPVSDGESTGGNDERPVSQPALDPAAEPAAKPGFDKRIPRLGGGVPYIVYYGSWSDEKIERAMSARLVIGDFDTGSATREQVQRLRRGVNGLEGTSDDVTVIAYLSPMQERDRGDGPQVGNAQGPRQIRGDQLGEPSGGYASYYVDALTQDGSRVKSRAPDGKPDRTDSDTGFRINPADPAWRELLAATARELLIDQGADGLFLDVLDAAQPSGAYSALIPAASETVRWLSESFPSKYLIANRGFYLFESDPEIWYSRYNVRPYVSAVMFENHYTEWDYDQRAGVWSPWAGYFKQTARLQAESEKADGFQVLVLDYVNPAQVDCAELVERQREAVEREGGGSWMNLVAVIDLNTVGFPGCRSGANKASY